MIPKFKSHYFAFLMKGTLEDFRAASAALDAALSHGSTTAEAQKAMDEARTDAELLCILFDSHTLQGIG